MAVSDARSKFGVIRVLSASEPTPPADPAKKQRRESSWRWAFVFFIVRFESNIS
jgi:hypothetical protein